MRPGRVTRVFLAAIALAALVVGLLGPVVQQTRASIPVVGDRSARPVTWEPTTGQWSMGSPSVRLGGVGHVPVAGDWDGDGRVDPGTWDPTSGEWTLPGHGDVALGLPGDVAVPCGWGSGGELEPGVWRPSDGSWFARSGVVAQVGQEGDVPVPGDWGGNGPCEPTVFRDGRWIGAHDIVHFGLPGDVPVPADWDGDGDPERAVWRPVDGSWWVEDAAGARLLGHLGAPGDVAVPVDWDGDGRPEPGIWRRDGRWFARSGVIHTGPPTALPVPVAAAGVSIGTVAPVGAWAGDRDGARRSGLAGAVVAVLAVLAVLAPTVGWLLGRRTAATSSTPAKRRRRGRSGERFLLAGAALLPMTAVRVGPIAAGDVVLLLAGAVVLSKQGWRHARRSELPSGLPAAAFGVACAAAMAASASSGGLDDTRSLVRVVVGVGLPVGVLWLFGPGPDLRRCLSVAFAGGAALSAVWGIVTVGGDERVRGLATHPNHLGLICLLGVALAIGASHVGTTGIVVVPLLVANVAGLITSGSRSALVGFLVVIGAAVGERRHRAGALLPVLGGVALLVAGWHGAVIERLADAAASDLGRMFRLEISVERIVRAPLTGAGLRFVEEAHSVPLQLWASSGLTGMLSFLVLLALPLRALRPGAEALQRWTGTAWAAFLVTATVQNIVIDRYLWFVAALAMVDARPRTVRPDSVDETALAAMLDSTTTRN